MAYKGPKSTSTREGVLRLSNDLDNATDGLGAKVKGILGYSIIGTPSQAGQVLAWDPTSGGRWKVRKLGYGDLGTPLATTASQTTNTGIKRVGSVIVSAGVSIGVSGDTFNTPVNITITSNGTAGTNPVGTLNLVANTSPTSATGTVTPSSGWVSTVLASAASGEGVRFSATSISTTPDQETSTNNLFGGISWGAPMISGMTTIPGTYNSTFLTTTLAEAVGGSSTGVSTGAITDLVTQPANGDYSTPIRVTPTEIADATVYAFFACPASFTVNTNTNAPWKLWAPTKGSEPPSGSYAFVLATPSTVDVTFTPVGGVPATIAYKIYRTNEALQLSTLGMLITDPWLFRAKFGT